MQLEARLRVQESGWRRGRRPGRGGRAPGGDHLRGRRRGAVGVVASSAAAIDPLARLGHASPRSCSGVAAPVSTRRRALRQERVMATRSPRSPSSGRYPCSASLPAWPHSRTTCAGAGTAGRRDAAHDVDRLGHGVPHLVDLALARGVAQVRLRWPNVSSIQPVGVGTLIPVPLSSHTKRIGMGRPIRARVARGVERRPGRSRGWPMRRRTST